MKITKWTHNKATKLNLEIAHGTITDARGTEFASVGIYGVENGEPFCEFTVAYHDTDDGLFYHGTCFPTLVEDTPRWIANDKKLRDLLPAIAAATPFSS